MAILASASRWVRTGLPFASSTKRHVVSSRRPGKAGLRKRDRPLDARAVRGVASMAPRRREAVIATWPVLQRGVLRHGGADAVGAELDRPALRCRARPARAQGL